MTTDKEVKKKVMADWQNMFPELALYSQDKLYKIAGATIIGLELIKLPRTEEYRPHFVAYPLWENTIKKCFNYTIILREFKNKRGFQYNIPYDKHNAFFSDAVESVKNQALLPFDSSIPFKKIMSVMDEYSKMPPLSAAPNSYLQAALQEAKLKIALFVGVTEAQSILEQINKRSWDTTHFKACGIDVNEWLHELHETLSNRDKFLAQIETNKLDKKISLLKSSELIR